MPRTPSRTLLDIAAFYAFSELSARELPGLSARLRARAEELEIAGLMIIGAEGVNATIAGSKPRMEEFLAFLAPLVGRERLEAKWSRAERAPFRKFAVKIRDEIVTIGKPELRPSPTASPRRSLSPEDWHRELSVPGTIVLDTRNWYETRMGKFRSAVDPGIDEFHEFPEFLKNSGLAKDQRVLIYCTGGIRCEKAILEMDRQGFTDVAQLDGGILAYLEKFPDTAFEGDCFVFDHRVALNQKLEPSGRYGLCPHCGQPAEITIHCARCDSPALVCAACHEKENARRTCSKNCAHHARLTPGKKGRPPQPQGPRLSARARH